MATKFWIFDLDNTLHNATPHIFPHINRAMTAYLQQRLEANPGNTFNACVNRINFLRLKVSASTPPKRPKKMKGTAWKKPARPS